LTKAFADLANRIIHDPERFADAQINLWQGYIKIWQAAMARSQGKDVPPVISPSPTDKRFKDAEWQSNWIFDYLKQSYLLTAQWVHGVVRQESAALDPKEARKLEFYTRQMVDAISPSNFWMTNPEVLRATIESGGENLVKGLENLLGDLERGNGQLRISMSDLTAFKVGENLATTPGKVVYQNHLMQLIQYEPQTPTVHATPLLIMPPWINKYYILDLKEKNSFVGYLVKQGYTVFVISWVNPDQRHAHVHFDDYMMDGCLESMRQIRKATGQENINIVGYCIGGTLLASTMAYLNAVPQKPTGLPKVTSATYLVTLVDFSEPGDLGVFIDDAQVTAIDEHMQKQGYLEAAAMATTFNLLRANDLIWSFVVNNYLLGKEPFPFDILFWNGDSTNLPAAMHSFYLRKMYIENKLVQPNGLTMKDVPIDLTSINVPSFMLSTRDDHIAPWRSTYAATQIYKGPIKFVLSGSGHIAGIVNPPSANKYGYWTNETLPTTPDAWLDKAEAHNGSWWPEWLSWLQAYAGEQIPAKAIDQSIENAPGSYVKVMAS
jgi:polyhydroxyalkanoate synthase